MVTVVKGMAANSGTEVFTQAYLSREEVPTHCCKGQGSAGINNTPCKASVTSHQFCERAVSPVSASLYIFHSFTIPSGSGVKLNVYTVL